MVHVKVINCRISKVSNCTLHNTADVHLSLAALYLLSLIVTICSVKWTAIKHWDTYLRMIDRVIYHHSATITVAVIAVGMGCSCDIEITQGVSDMRILAHFP